MKKRKPYQPKKGTQPKQYTIARALDAFEADEETYLCAFLQAAESAFKAGHIRGWMLSHLEDGKYELAISEHDTGGIIPVLAPTLKDATKALSEILIREGMKGAAEA